MHAACEVENEDKLKIIIYILYQSCSIKNILCGLIEMIRKQRY